MRRGERAGLGAGRRPGGLPHKGWRAVASLVAVCGVVAGISLLTPHVGALELKSYDFLMTVLRGPKAPPPDIAIVAIDETSIKEFAEQFSWPWPRSVHGELVRQLNAAGARAIVFDVVFDVASDAREDSAFAEAIRGSAAPVVLAAAIENVQDRQFQATQQIRPLGVFTDAGARIGFASIHPDSDGELRRAPRCVAGMPSLASAAFDGRCGEDFLVDYAGPARTIATASYYQALDFQKSLPPGFFKNKTVFVGRSLSAQEARAAAQDMFPTPFDPLMPGVEIHANALATLRRGEPLRRAGAGWMWGLLALSGALVAVVMASPLRLQRKLPLAGGLVLVAPAVAAAAFLAGGWWVYSVQPVMVAGGVFVVNALEQYRAAERERLHVRKALTGYVSKQVLRRLLDHPAALQLGGVQVQATVLFSDIAGFSSISEKIAPGELAAELNRYFSRIGDVIMQHDGMIDKYIGDAVMAVWGAPLADEKQASRACAAALAMRRTLAATGGPMKTRIGVNTGTVMAGNLGHHERMNYTVIGDAVNLASRLEGANKYYGTTVLVSEFTKTEAEGDFVFRRVDRIRVVGKQEPVGVYEVLCGRGEEGAEREQARADSFAEILEAYDRREWEEALQAAARHRAAYTEEDSVVRVYEKRCEEFLAAAPAAEWDGVYVFRSK